MKNAKSRTAPRMRTRTGSELPSPVLIDVTAGPPRVPRPPVASRPRAAAARCEEPTPSALPAARSEGEPPLATEPESEAALVVGPPEEADNPSCLPAARRDELPRPRPAGRAPGRAGEGRRGVMGEILPGARTHSTLAHGPRCSRPASEPPPRPRAGSGSSNGLPVTAMKQRHAQA